MHGWYYSQISAWLSMFNLGLFFTFFLHLVTWSTNKFVITFAFVFANIWRSLEVEFNFEDLLHTHISQKYNCCRSSECEGQIEIFQMNWYIQAWMQCINIKPYNFSQWFRPDQTRQLKQIQQRQRQENCNFNFADLNLENSSSSLEKSFDKPHYTKCFTMHTPLKERYCWGMRML